jgi:hypothetical protein
VSRPSLLHARPRQPFVGGNGLRCAPVPAGRPHGAAVAAGCGLSRELLKRSQARSKVPQLTGGCPTGKAHIATEPETGLVTAAALTPATAADGPTGVGLLAGEPAGLEVLGDSAYGGGPTRSALRAAGHLQTIKPIGSRAAVPGGFTKDDFVIDLAAQTVTCPAGHTVPVMAKGQAAFKQRCASCPLHARCTTATGGRTVQIYPWEAELQAARRQAADPLFQPATGGGGRWWNARSPGWWLGATGGSATAAWSATSIGCRCGSPPSTCAGWSASACDATTPAGRSPSQ